jgi:2-polyprenyl-3-methyl-5-hydroxy-6-metoxy-1,4-benzoquinol methylase
MLNRLKIGGLGRIRRIRWRLVDFVNPSHPFLTEDATRINEARQQHLDLFKTVIDEKTVLEVGAGIGLFSEKVANRAKSMLVTEGRSPLVRILRKRLKNFHNVSVLKVDVENPKEIKRLCESGKYDLLLCYGLLYHLSNPKEFLRRFSPLTKNLILETVVDFSSENWITIKENPRTNQAIHLGCRPNPNWLL